MIPPLTIFTGNELSEALAPAAMAWSLLQLHLRCLHDAVDDAYVRDAVNDLLVVASERIKGGAAKSA